MHIEKSNAIAFTKLAAFDIKEPTANFNETTDRNVTGNQRVGNTFQPSLLQINVRAADFRKFDLKQSRVLFKLRTRNFAQLDGSIWPGDDSDQRHEGKVKEKGKKGRRGRQNAEGRRQNAEGRRQKAVSSTCGWRSKQGSSPTLREGSVFTCR